MRLHISYFYAMEEMTLPELWAQSAPEQLLEAWWAQLNKDLGVLGVALSLPAEAGDAVPNFKEQLLPNLEKALSQPGDALWQCLYAVDVPEPAPMEAEALADAILRRTLLKVLLRFKFRMA